MKKRTRKKALHRIIWMYNHKSYDKFYKTMRRYGNITEKDFYNWFFTTKVSYLEKNENNEWCEVN